MVLIESILLMYFGFTTFYMAVLFIAGLFYRDQKVDFDQTIKFSKFCVLIPAYKEDGVILSVAKASLEQDYPVDSYSVYIIADSLKAETIELLKALPVVTLVVSFETSTKMKALNKALESIDTPFDYAVILDADNVMEPDFLSRMNVLHQMGYRSIQGQRIAKNENNTMAILDGISEAINYSIISRGSSALGASPGVKGSGMSFEFKSIKKIFASLESVGGFDRELELKLIENKMPIYYSENTKVMDEKVGSVEVFKRQRTRWISSQFFYLRKYFRQGIQSLAKGDIVYFNSAVLRNIQLPRLINVGLLFIAASLLFFIRNNLYFGYSVWLTFALINMVVIFGSIPLSMYNRKLVLALIQVPGIFLSMFMLLFKLKGANKKFIHTPHNENNPV